MRPSVPRRQHAVKRDEPVRERKSTAREDAPPAVPAGAARSAEGDALSRLVVRILQLNGRLTAIGDALAAPAQQSAARWQILAAVEDAPRSVAEIARLLGLARQSVQ